MIATESTGVTASAAPQPSQLKALGLLLAAVLMVAGFLLLCGALGPPHTIMNACTRAEYMLWSDADDDVRGRQASLSRLIA
jgi:hypothetical protein